MDYDDATNIFFELFPQYSSLQETISLSVILPRIIPKKELWYIYMYKISDMPLILLFLSRIFDWCKIYIEWNVHF